MPRRYAPRNDEVPAQIASALHNSSKGTSSQDSWGFASLKLGISDSVVEVSLQGTIRLKEAELPRLMGLCTIRLKEAELPRLMGRRAPRTLREEIFLVKKKFSF